jgi:WD40 repeat protein
MSTRSVSRREWMIGAASAMAVSALPLDALAQRQVSSFLPGQSLGQEYSMGTLRFFDGQRLLVAGGNGPYINTPTLLDIETGTVLQTFPGHTEPVSVIAVSPDGTRLATGAGKDGGDIAVRSTDHTIRIWEVASGREIRRFDYSPKSDKLGDGVVGCLQFSRDGRRLLSVGMWTLRVWDIATGQELFTLGDASAPFLSSACFSPDMRTILVEQAGGLGLLDYANGKELRTIDPFSRLWHAEFSPDGSKIATAAVRLAQIWDTNTGREIQSFTASRTFITWAVFSPDGKSILTNFDSPSPELLNAQSAQLWDAQSGRPIRQFVHTGESGLRGSRTIKPVVNVGPAVFSPDGKRLMTHWSEVIRGIEHVSLWNVESGEELYRFDQSSRYRSISVVGFSPDGTTILVIDGISYKPASLWGAETGKLMRRYS